MITSLPSHLQPIANKLDAHTGAVDGNLEIEELQEGIHSLLPELTPQEAEHLKELSTILGLVDDPAAAKLSDIRTVEAEDGTSKSTTFNLEGGLQREVIEFDINDRQGLKIGRDGEISLPAQVEGQDIVGIKVHVKPSGTRFPSIVTAKVGDKDIPAFTGPKEEYTFREQGEIKLSTDNTSVISSIEVFYKNPEEISVDAPTATEAVTATGVDSSGDLNRLNDTQRAVLSDVKTKAVERSNNAKEALFGKLEGMGFSQEEIEKGMAYFKNDAPVTINFNPDKSLRQSTSGTSSDMEYSVSVDRSQTLIDAFIADAQYKNQFETGITSGSSSAYPGGSRDNWEKTIFEEGYHGHDLIPSERPKYGAVNAGQYAKGPASSYGSCYFVMKSGLRERSTITPKNSSACQAGQVGTFDDFYHVLDGMDDSRLKDVMNAALGRNEESRSSWSYIETQIHGPVEFEKDVESIVINEKFRGTEYEEKLLSWAEEKGFGVLWHDNQQVTPHGE